MHSIQKVLPILLIIATSGLASPILSRRAADLLARNHDGHGHQEDGYGHRHYYDEDRHEQDGLANGGNAGNGGFGGNGGYGGYIDVKKGDFGRYYTKRTEGYSSGIANGGLGAHGGNGGDGGSGGKISRVQGHGHYDEGAGHHSPQGNGGHGGFGGNGGHGGNGGEIHEEFRYSPHHEDEKYHYYRRRGLDEQLNLPDLFASGSASNSGDILALDGLSKGLTGEITGKSQDPTTAAFQEAEEAAAKKAQLELISKENEQSRKQNADQSQPTTPQEAQQPSQPPGRRSGSLRRDVPDDQVDGLTGVLGLGGPLFEVNEDELPSTDEF